MPLRVMVISEISLPIATTVILHYNIISMHKTTLKKFKQNGL